MTEPQIRELFDESRCDHRDAGRPRPVRAYLWHPPVPGDGPPPVVLVSHGSGGSGGEMTWLAEPLAAAGFLAVSVDHHGENFVDGYHAEGFAFPWERPRDFSFVLDVLAAERPLPAVGAVGFSAGGYTGAALVGARLDGDVLRMVLDGRVPLPPIREFPDLIETVHACVDPGRLARAVVEGVRDLADGRVGAAFLVCPGMGELVTPESLKGIGRPVAVRWGGADVVTPAESNALRYLGAIPDAEGRSAGADVEHYHFLRDDPDGAEVRGRVAAEAVEFFRTRL
ncbi:alpha/beta hydrolase family protein [Streptomyces sp. 4.24]|uniref:alpha/beta hydrolase family protein n=1 Tax=Streptomyces tritrimontium TaxID=3406573 RepID=UPI003BB4B596